MFVIQTGAPPGGGEGGAGLTAEEVMDLIASTLVAGANITIVYDDAANTITISGTGGGGGGLDAEGVQDVVGAMIVAGSGIGVSYNDAANTFTITNLAPDTGVPPTVEDVRDLIGATLVAGTNITIVVNDAADTVTINSSGLDTEQVTDLIGATLVAGSNITLTVNDAANTVTIASTGGAGGTVYPFAHKNRVRNGSFHLDSTKGGATAYSVAGPILDCWNIGSMTGGGTFTAQRVADPDDSTKFALKLAVTVADASIAADDGYTVYQTIEGYDIADLLSGTAAPKTITISFDMKFSVTGNYGVSIRNELANRGYVGNVAQLVANATESKTVTLTLDTTGTWNSGAGVGLYLTFCLAMGVNKQAASTGFWFGANIIAHTSQVNFMSSTSNVGYLKNFQLERGSVATAFDHGRSDGLASVETLYSRSQPFRNRVYNGNFRIDQIKEGGIYTMAAASNVRGPDGWTAGGNGTGLISIQRVQDPDFATGYALKITPNTADASLAAGDFYNIFTVIEGYDVADLASGQGAFADTITISFFMKFSVAGVYGVSVRNTAVNRSYIGSVTQNVANTNEFKVVTLNLDQAGTWTYTNDAGMYVGLCLGSGTDRIVPALGVWTAGNYNAAPGQTNFMASTGNIGYIKNFQVERGIVATPFEQATMIQQLARAQRYYEKSFPPGTIVSTGQGYVGGVAYRATTAGVSYKAVNIAFNTAKRTLPSITYYNPVSANGNWIGGAGDSGVPTTDVNGTHGIVIGNPQVAGDTLSAFIAIQWAADARLS